MTSGRYLRKEGDSKRSISSAVKKLFTKLEEITMQRPKMIEQTVYKWIEGKYERITGPNQIPASEIKTWRSA